MNNSEKLSRAKAQRIGELGYNRCGTLMKIIQYDNRNDVFVEFQDDYKYVTRVRYDHFKKGTAYNPYDKTVNGVGCFGVGPYIAYDDNGKATKQYSIWKLMLNRVYDKYGRLKNESYIKCSVCDEWLNFQNFGKWFDENFYQLDEEKNVSR